MARIVIMNDDWTTCGEWSDDRREVGDLDDLTDRHLLLREMTKTLAACRAVEGRDNHGNKLARR